MEQTQTNRLFRWFFGVAMDDAVRASRVSSKNRKRLIAHDAVGCVGGAGQRCSIAALRACLVGVERARGDWLVRRNRMPVPLARPHQCINASMHQCIVRAKQLAMRYCGRGYGGRGFDARSQIPRHGHRRINGPGQTGDLIPSPKSQVPSPKSQVPSQLTPLHQQPVVDNAVPPLSRFD